MLYKCDKTGKLQLIVAVFINYILIFGKDEEYTNLKKHLSKST